MAAAAGAVAPQEAPNESHKMDPISRLHKKLKEYEALLRHVAVVMAALVASLFATGNGILLVNWIILPVWNFALLVIGTTMGIGLGLGLASHVHDRLEVWHARHDAETNTESSSKLKSTATTSYQRVRSSSMRISSNNNSSAWEEETNYASLMASAGYDVSDRIHRCQVLRSSSSFLKPFYPFTNVPPEEQHGPQIMAQQWPHLSSSISFQLGRFIEHVVRDFVASWYSIIDPGCPYENEKEKRKRIKQAEENGETDETDQKPSQEQEPSSDRVMVWSTATSRPLPMLHTVYHTLAIMMGNLSARVEHVNVFSLILVKWTRVLGHSFKVYRQMRRLAIKKSASPQDSNKSKRKKSKSPKKSLKRSHSAPLRDPPTRTQPSRSVASSVMGTNAELLNLQQAQEDDEEGNLTQSAPSSSQHLSNVAEEGEEDLRPDDADKDNHGEEEFDSKQKLPYVSEMAMAKEYLLAGKLHCAVTFGLDVPSLLFADTLGRECGVGSDDEEIPTNMTEDEVLEKRLFSTKVLSECEMDYCRILSHRFCRTLLPRSEFASPIIRTLFTEILAGNVISTIMGCFTPVYMNDWICTAIDKMSAVRQDAQEQGEDDIDDNDDDDEGIGVQSSEDGVDIVLESNDDEFDEKETSREKAIEIKIAGSDNDGDRSEKDEPDQSGDDTGDDEMEDHEKETSIYSFGTSDHDVDEHFDNDNMEQQSRDTPPKSAGQDILPLLAMALVDLSNHVDFDHCREARLGSEKVAIDWDAPACRQAVRRLVLVIEGALLHGCRSSRRRVPPKKREDTGDNHFDDGDKTKIDEDSFDHEVDSNHHEAVEVTLPQYQFSTLSQILMELTSDIDAFEERVATEEREHAIEVEEAPIDDEEAPIDAERKPTKTEVSTLRTLIAAWLHTGQIYHIVSVIALARTSILEPFYKESSFLRNPDNARDLVQQLKTLDGVDILVDTMDVLSSSTLDFEGRQVRMVEPQEVEIPEAIEQSAPVLPFPEVDGSASPKPNHDMEGSASTNGAIHRPSLAGSTKRLVVGNSHDHTVSPSSTRSTIESPGASGALGQRYFGSATPRYLDFSRNEAFASSLRHERERRMKSWADVTAVKEGEMPGMICRSKGLQKRDKVIHRELHNMSRILYAGTNMLAIRSGGRRRNTEDSAGHASVDSVAEVESDQVSLLTAETASQRRRIEVPDDDSSFLLRAQPRALDPVGIHRDQRNTDHSYKSYCATYEEPAIPAGENKYRGGRYIRRCVLRYYPTDRTATIVLPNDYRQLDHRLERDTIGDASTIESSASSSFLSSEFLRERHLCKKWYQKGQAPRPGSILTSSVMEPSDFCAVPRTGRALDFVYRVKLFESPMVELGGKRFTVHDSACAGVHRADASSLELSDAALSTALLTIGSGMEETDVSGDNVSDSTLNSGEDHLQRNVASRRPRVESGPDGYPVIFLKFSKKQGDTSNVEMKPCRTSYIRASLLIASARQSAQLQCLLKCVQAGSARSATRARTEAKLWPTLKLLEFANGSVRDKQSVLLRDLKLGINHIDREQLRRNGLLQPRSPTSIVSLSTVIEDALQAKDTGVELRTSSPNEIVFKVRCVAIVELASSIDDEELALNYHGGEPSDSSRLFREEWVVYRSYREFSHFHKHLKTQVAVSETSASASAGARLVGVAAAALAVHGGPTGSTRSRQGMIPSLGQAKAGALGATKKTIQKRKAVLGSYLKHLTSPDNFLNRCPELQLFLGAFYPLPPDVETGAGVVDHYRDSLGRTNMSRTMLERTPSRQGITDSKSVSIEQPSQINEDKTGAINASSSADAVDGKPAEATKSPVASEDGVSEELAAKKKAQKKRRSKKVVMKPYIKAKIDQVSLGEVRFCIFELVRYLFDFDNASFFRSQVFQALKTMSMAVTTSSEFRKTLYETHVKSLNADAMAGWVRFGLDMLWPDGAFFDPKPPPTREEATEMAARSKLMLPTAFPDQIRAILGQEITQNGFEILHEMLQNRLVLKSMAYMLFDLVWLEVFPELQDILTCGSALDMD